jgi:hypothetical protein
LPAASTAADLSPVAVPAGSGLGPSSAKLKADNPANIPARRTVVAPDAINLRRRDLPARFVISESSYVCVVQQFSVSSADEN